MIRTVPNDPEPPTPPPCHEPDRERRAYTRYAAAEPSSWVGWFVAQRFIVLPSRLEDLSLGGARLCIDPALTAGDPSPGATVFIGIGRPGPDDWIEARLLGRGESTTGPGRLRVMFLSGCPYDQFRGAIWGKAASHAPRPQAQA